MKKIVLLGLLVVATATVAFAQGSIQFATYNAANTAKGEVFLPTDFGGGGPVPGGTVWDAQLWFSDVGSALSTANNWTALSPVVNFSTAVAGYINYGTVTDTADPPGATIWIDLRVWSASAGSSWPGTSIALDTTVSGLTAGGLSGYAKITNLGGIDSTGTIYSLPYANGFNNFTLTFVPEPGIMALAGLGIASLLIFRRRK